MKKREALIIKSYVKEHIRAAVIYGIIVMILLGIAGIYDYEEAATAYLCHNTANQINYPIVSAAG